MQRVELGLCERAAQFGRSVLRFLCWTYVVPAQTHAATEIDVLRFDQMNPCVNEIVASRGRAGRVVLCVLEVEICRPASAGRGPYRSGKTRAAHRVKNVCGVRSASGSGIICKLHGAAGPGGELPGFLAESFAVWDRCAVGGRPRWVVCS